MGTLLISCYAILSFKGNAMKTMTTTALGAFVLDIAKGGQKMQNMPEAKAKEAREQLSARISTKVEEIRSSQRRNFDESKTITVF